MGYVVASQALLDISGWSFLAVGCATLLAGLLIIGTLLRVSKLKVGRWIYVPVAFISYCVLRSFSGIKEAHPFDVLLSIASAFVGGMAVAVALKAGVRFRWLAYAQLASNLLQISIVLFGLEAASPELREDTFRYAGMTGNPNALALQLTLGACMIWLLPRKAGLIPCLFAVGAVAFAVAVTGSRKALLVAFFFLVLVCIQGVDLLPRGRHRRLWVTSVIAAPCLLGLFLAPSVYQHAQDILAVQRSFDYEDSSYQTRTEMIQQGIELWLKAPLFGNGLDSFRALSGQDTYSHNNYVELLSGVGLVGALLFYSIHTQVLFRAAHARRFLRHYCWVLIVTLLMADLGYVSYKSKQSVMILMVLTVVTTSRYGLHHRQHDRKQGDSGRHGRKPELRRFVMQT